MAAFFFFTLCYRPQFLEAAPDRIKFVRYFVVEALERGDGSNGDQRCNQGDVPPKNSTRENWSSLVN
jgi:hypothetical protein